MKFWQSKEARVGNLPKCDEGAFQNSKDIFNIYISLGRNDRALAWFALRKQRSGVMCKSLA